MQKRMQIVFYRPLAFYIYVWCITVQLVCEHVLQAIVADAAEGSFYVVVSLLADPKKSQSLCTPHPTTLLTSKPSSSQSPSAGAVAAVGTATAVGGSGVDLESPYLFSLLDQEEESHTVYHSASPCFDR